MQWNNLSPVNLLPGHKNIAILKVILFIGLLHVSPLKAQLRIPGYAVEHYTDENGLVQNSINFIAASNSGHIWAATEGGLLRFDGRNFVYYDKRNLALKSSRMSAMFPGTDGSDLYCITAQNDLISIKNATATVYGKELKPYKYCEMSDTLDHWILRSQPDLYINFSDDSEMWAPVGPNQYYRITSEAIISERIDSLSGKTGQFFSIPYDKNWLISRFFVLDQALFYLAKDGNLLKIENGSNREITLKLPGYSKTEQDESTVYWNFPAGQVFLRIGHSLYFLNKDASGSYLWEELMHGVDFNAKLIFDIFYDKEHARVFLGSKTKGLYVCTKKQFTTLLQGDEDQVYYALAPFGDSMIFSPKGYLFAPGKGAREIGIIDSLGLVNQLFTITKDHGGNFWLKNNNEIVALNPGLNKLLWRHEFRDFKYIKQIFVDEADDLYISFKYEGLYKMPATGPYGRIEPVDTRLKDIDFIASDPGKELWVGTNKGLYIYNKQTGALDTLHAFDGMMLRSMQQFAPGSWIVTTYGKGAFIVKDRQVIAIPLDRKQYLLYSHCALFDSNGYCWISTNKGLFKMSLQDLISYANGQSRYVYQYYYDKDDGFGTNEFNGGCEPCALSLGNGSFSFPSINGIVYFNPLQVRVNLPTNPLHVDQIMVDTTVLPMRDTIQLPHAFQRLQVFTSSAYFGNQANLQCSYRLFLEGESGLAPWLDMNAGEVLNFNSLPSGDYILELRKINGFGLNNFTVSKIFISIQPAYYETTWFRIAMLLVILGSMVLYIRWRLKRVSMKNKILEKKVSERTATLHEALEHLTRSEQLLKRQAYMQERLITAISHDVRTPLKYLQDRLNSNDGNLDRFDREITTASISEMMHLVENIIEYMKSQIGSGSGSLELTGLHGLIEGKLSMFQPLVQAKDIKVVNGIDPGLAVYINRQLLSIVIHNLLDNSLKYMQSGVLRISALAAGEQLQIVIEDEGRGMPPVYIEWIEQYQVENANNKQFPPGKGIGMLLVLDLLVILNGKLNARLKDDGRGTVFTLDFQVFDQGK